MTFFTVEGFCDSDGERLSLGTVIVEAEDESDAENEAWKELWDSRLSGAGGGFRAIVDELGMDPGLEVTTPDGIGVVEDEDPQELGAGAGYAYPVRLQGVVEYYPEHTLVPKDCVN